MSNQSKFGQQTSLIALGCIILLQALGGSPSILPACSTLMEQHYHVSYLQINILIAALETGKLFGFLPDAAADYFPSWMVLFVGLIFGLVGYGVQYLYIAYKTPPALCYWQALLLNALAGNSCCWINTYCRILAVRNFKTCHRTITTITSTYSGLSGKIYASLVEGIVGKKLNSDNSSTYLLLTCLAPAILGFPLVLVDSSLKIMESGDHVEMVPVLLLLSIVAGVYGVIGSVVTNLTPMWQQVLAVIFALVLMLPFALAVLISAYEFAIERCQSSRAMVEMHVDFCDSASKCVTKELQITIDNEDKTQAEVKEDAVEVFVTEDKKAMEENIFSVEFLFCYLVDACGATLGMVYFNNLEHISVSRMNSETSFLLAISSTFGFFGRIFSVMFHWYTRDNSLISDTILNVLLMLPIPAAFFMLFSDNNKCLYISTGILGTCSGAINASTMSDHYGCTNLALKRIIFGTKTPLCSLLFGCMAALNYQREGDGGMCVGCHCFYSTFIIWGSVSVFGTILSYLFHLRVQKLKLAAHISSSYHL